MQRAFGAALLAIFMYFFVTPYDDQPTFQFTSNFSKDSRLPFHSRFIDSGGQRVFVSVHIKNPSAAYFALCVQQPGVTLPQYVAPFLHCFL
jgi:hypothetical protein